MEWDDLQPPWVAISVSLVIFSDYLVISGHIYHQMKLFRRLFSVTSSQLSKFYESENTSRLFRQIELPDIFSNLATKPCVCHPTEGLRLLLRHPRCFHRNLCYFHGIQIFWNSQDAFGGKGMFGNRLAFNNHFCGGDLVIISFFHDHADFSSIMKEILIRYVSFHRVNWAKRDSIFIRSFIFPTTVHMVAYYSAIRTFLIPSHL